jgi:hypothetical protein
MSNKCVICGKDLIYYGWLNADPKDPTPHYWHRHGYDYFESFILPKFFRQINLEDDNNFVIAEQPQVGFLFSTKGITERISMFVTEHTTRFRALKLCPECLKKRIPDTSREKVEFT